MAIQDQDGSVLTCVMADCSYNWALECRAAEIQVGDDHPSCDTFTTQEVMASMEPEAVVMTCGVAECHFNGDMHCRARGITVDRHSKHADCVTFRP